MRPRVVVSLYEHSGLNAFRHGGKLARGSKTGLIVCPNCHVSLRCVDLSTGAVDLSAAPIILSRQVCPWVGVLMRRLSLGLLSAACAIGFAQIASAAPVNSPAIWTGFYIGGNVGHSWGRSNTSLPFTDAASGATLNSVSTTANLNGLIGGAQAGYNWQTSNWILGLEADIQASAQSGLTGGFCGAGALTSVATLNSACAPGHIGDTTPNNVAALAVTTTLSQKLEWFGTVRGRVGPTITPGLLAYVTGGLAYGQVNSTNSVSGTNVTGAPGTNTFTLTPVSASFSSSDTKIGWTVGGGFEGVLGGNWSGKIEYIYVDLGTVSGAFSTPIVTTSGALLVSRFSSHITDNILRVGLNYKFGAPTRP
jgi:outer membrane immunogenic protein